MYRIFIVYPNGEQLFNPQPYDLSQLLEFCECFAKEYPAFRVEMAGSNHCG